MVGQGMSEIPEENFDFEQAYMSLFIQQSRVYDVLMALLTHTAPEKAADLMELHAQGFLVAAVPSFNGTFIASVGQEIEDEQGT